MRKTVFAKHLPDIGQIVSIRLRGISCPLFETTVIGRMPYDYGSDILNKLPNEDIIIEDAIFKLSFAPVGFDTILFYIRSCWRINEKDAYKSNIVTLEIIS